MINSTLKKIDALLMGQSMKDEVKKIFMEYANRKPLLIFENVSSNIICSQITGNRQLLDLTLKITPENIEAVNIAYRKSGKIRVIIEVQP